MGMIWVCADAVLRSVVARVCDREEARQAMMGLHEESKQVRIGRTVPVSDAYDRLLPK